MTEEQPLEEQVEEGPSGTAEQGDRSSTTVADALPSAEPASLDPGNLPALNVQAGGQSNDIQLLHDVDLNVKIELGRTRMLVEDVLRLGEGSVVELEKLAGDPVDIFVNEQLVARGEILVLNDNFCVRINEIVATTVPS